MKESISMIHLKINPLEWFIYLSNYCYNYQRKICFLCFVLTIDYKYKIE